jgi:acyl-coenzyme A thioesterase PaaI-like protein
MKPVLDSLNTQLDAYNKQIKNLVKNWVNDVTLNANNSTFSQLKVTSALKLVTQFVGQAIPFASRNGFKVIDFRPGYVKAFIPLKSNANHFNAMYAGALFTVAELPGGIISVFSFDERFFPILKDLKIEFIKMAKTDVTVEFEISASEYSRLENEVSVHGKCDFVLQGEIKNEQGEIVAKSLANYQLRMK